MIVSCHIGLESIPLASEHVTLCCCPGTIGTFNHPSTIRLMIFNMSIMTTWVNTFIMVSKTTFPYSFPFSHNVHSPLSVTIVPGTYGFSGCHINGPYTLPAIMTIHEGASVHVCIILFSMEKVNPGHILMKKCLTLLSFITTLLEMTSM